ncbi:MAG: protein-L-isoaspartate(D-aspartate) O-methyltransferase [Nitriliruptorales bacterium]|nr:protein-L-isoaspartate(D-aspartate) O-methyltransferase [Nitriliruptorales bacterium]
MSTDPLVRATRRMGVRDERVLSAIAEVDRRLFVPQGETDAADQDRPIPIPHGQTTSQPSLIATMVDALELTGTENVLEVGTGLGYQAAVLSRLAATVTSVERFPELAAAARDNLAAADSDNVQVVVGDGTKGWPENAPYDAIIVAAAFPEVPAPLAEQLSDGGRLIQPIGAGGMEEVALFRRDGEQISRVRDVVGARFVRLVGEHGFADERPS